MAEILSRSWSTVMPRCANPDCPDASLSDMTMRHHWVQVQETDLAQAGQAESAGTVRHLFAVITCSKRCAAAVLAAQLPAEDAERQARREMFGAVGADQSR
jgi:hypothetical protein